MSRYARSHAEVRLKSLSEIPAASSPGLRTCDNSQYESKSKGDPVHASGFAYSSPFWDVDGRFRGLISSIFRTDILVAMLAGVPVWPVTAADSAEMRRGGWKVPESPADFVLVNPSKGIVAGDPRDSAWIRDAVEIAKRPVVPGGDGNWSAESLDVVDDSPWIIVYRYHPATIANLVSQSTRTRWLEIVGVWLIVAAGWGWGRAVERKRQDLARLATQIDATASGDLMPMSLARKNARDEAGILLERFDLFRQDLATRIRDLLELASSLAAMSNGLESDAQRLLSRGEESSRSAEQAADGSRTGSDSLQTVASAAEQMSAGMESIAAAIEELAATASTIVESCGRQEVESAHALAEVDKVLEMAMELSRSAESIGTVVGTISNIAVAQSAQGFRRIDAAAHEVANQTKDSAEATRGLFGLTQNLSGMAIRIKETLGFFRASP